MKAKSVALAAALLSGSGAEAQSSAPILVATESGNVRGASDNGVLTWKGVPFAAAPVGDLRWRAPQPAAAWTGTRDATAYAPECPQVVTPGDKTPLQSPTSEDCLYLNVWRPARAESKLPVLVWIYGGGFVKGGSSIAIYSGARLARHGILVVSLNYRLGRFGTFALPSLTRANADDGLLGNYGIMDQIAGLKWIRHNVAAFGGDPDNVTIMGESAGGVSAHILATSRMTEGLFRRAVIMSGAEGGRTGTATLAEQEGLGATFARVNGIDPASPDALAKLRALPVERVVGRLDMAETFKQAPRTWTGPFVDGTVVTDIGAAYASGAFRQVPMMIGATSGDLEGRTGFMIAGARRISATIAAKGVPVYQYRFDYVPTSANDEAAPHASDIPFFFDTQDVRYGARTSSRDRAMGLTISAMLLNFVRTGNPNGPGSLDWPREGQPSGTLMTFTRDGHAHAGIDPWASEIDAAPPPAYPDFIADARKAARP